MQNVAAVTSLADFRDTFDVDSSRVVRFGVESLAYSTERESVVVDDAYVMSPAAMKTLMKEIGVHRKVFESQDRLAEDEWENVKRALDSVNKGRYFLGKSRSIDLTVLDMYFDNPLRQGASNIPLDAYVLALSDVLEETEVEYDVISAYYDAVEERAVIGLLRRGSGFPVATDGSTSDIWKHGHIFTFDRLSYAQYPTLMSEQHGSGMICVNRGWKADVRHGKFSLPKIQKAMERITKTGDNDSLQNIAKSRAAYQQGVSASVAELMKYRAKLEKWDEENGGLYTEAIDTYFSLSRVVSEYRVVVESQTVRWKETADSGRSVYDIFTLLISLAGNKDVAELSSLHSIELRADAALWFFRDWYDKTQIAPKLTFKVPFPRISSAIQGSSVSA